MLEYDQTELDHYPESYYQSQSRFDHEFEECVSSRPLKVVVSM